MISNRRGRVPLDPRGPKTRGAAPREGGAKILGFLKRRERIYKQLHVPRRV
nr:MAG TPA: hypothetical protein [Caudoviricetes sp.]